MTFKQVLWAILWSAYTLILLNKCCDESLKILNILSSIFNFHTIQKNNPLIFVPFWKARGLNRSGYDGDTVWEQTCKDDNTLHYSLYNLVLCRAVLVQSHPSAWNAVNLGILKIHYISYVSLIVYFFLYQNEYLWILHQEFWPQGASFTVTWYLHVHIV